MIPEVVKGQQLMLLMRRKQQFADMQLTKGGTGSEEQDTGGAGIADEQGTSW